MRSRHVASILLSLGLLALFAAGCGSSSGSGGSSPLMTELSYLPAGSPLVLTLQTEPKSRAIQQSHALEGRFPLAAFGQAALTSKLQQLGINYSTDIRPLFGNPVALSAAGSTLAGRAGNNFVIVWITKDADKLSALLKKLGAQQHSVGTRDGAKLYALGTSSLAVDGATLVFGANPTAVANALDRHAHGGGISSAQYSRETAGIDPSSLLQVFGDLTTVLGTPKAASARRVPWVAALRGYGVALSSSANGLSLRFHLDTTGRTLTAAQLPFAAGASAPTLAGTGPVAVGIHDPAQIISFAEAASQQSGGSGYLHFLSRQSQLRARTGVDVNSLAAGLTGDLLVSSDTHRTMVRAAVSNPAAVAKDLAKLAADPRDLFSNPATSIRKLPGGFYAVVEPKRTTNIGVAAGQLVGGNAPVAALRAYAAAPASATGAQGTVAFRIALQELLQRTLHTSLPQAAQTALAQLGDITGWASASPTGVNGSASLALK